MKHDLLTPMELAEIELPSVDGTQRFEIDQQIRACGYTVLERPANGQAIWQKGGIPFAQEDVMFREGLIQWPLGFKT